MNENIKWKIFKIKDIFETYNGTNGLQTPTGSYINKKELKEGNIPRITVKDTNNGIDNFSISENKNFRVFENFISVSFLGSVFYHPYKASLDMKVHALILKNKKMNIYIAEFLKVMIRNNLKKSSYGNQMSSTDLPNIRIMLPINDTNTPNWSFMETYIKEIRKEKIRAYNEYITKELESLETVHTHTHGVLLENKKWKAILLNELFIIKKGNQNNMAKLSSGDIPLVSAKKIDNGFKDFVNANEKKIFPQNILSLNNDGDGGAGISYYQPTKMLLDTHVTALIPKYQNANKYNLMFIACSITKQREKFGHGYSLNNERLNNFKFMIPVTEDENIDFEYMEICIILKLKEMLTKYLLYINQY